MPREFLFAPEGEAAPPALGSFKALLGQKGGPAGRTRKSVVSSPILTSLTVSPETCALQCLRHAMS
jgi:hypothetical protein